MSIILLRQFIPEQDTGIIMSTWPKGFYYSGINIKPKSQKKLWFSEYYDYVKRMLKDGQVSIACMTDDADTILGYAVMNGSTLEWIYVKEAFRKQGIANLMLKGKKIESVSNLTKIGKSIAEAHGLKEK